MLVRGSPALCPEELHAVSFVAASTLQGRVKRKLTHMDAINSQVHAVVLARGEFQGH